MGNDEVKKKSKEQIIRETKDRADAYNRALIAGRVLDPEIFPRVVDALHIALDKEKPDEKEGFEIFSKACGDAGVKGKIVVQMWEASLASRKAQSSIPCW